MVAVLWTAVFLQGMLYAIPVQLQCEYVQNPLGLDVPTPHFSWKSDNTERNWKQSAYQVLVSSSAEKLAAGTADVWDSGKVSSSESVGIAYGGPKLISKTRYFWRVRVWDAAGSRSQSAELAWWKRVFSKADWQAVDYLEEPARG
jgi:alpha-L-rhamnosidase